ncbi:MAG: hypothetical protein KDB53_21515, partial [Planctomycetes bacterium]|nr:hypothetical protein [Planctomycetota bacterium]
MRNMTQTFIIAASLVAATLVASQFLPATSASDGDRATIYRAPNVAVVDVERVINDYLRTTGDMDKVRAKSASERRALDEIRNL